MVRSHQEYFSNFPLHNVTGSLNLTPFMCNTIWALFPVTRFHSQFTPLSETLLNMWGSMRGFSEILNFAFTLDDIYFPITPPQICILTKPWFTIMKVDHPYTNFSTDNSFNNSLKSIRGKSIWFPLYLSNNLYCVGRMHKCPQHTPTQQGYLPVQVSEQLSESQIYPRWPQIMVPGWDDLLPDASLQGFLCL